MFGNVNVDYTPCKSAVQLDKAAKYILGELPEQYEKGIVKTRPDLVWEQYCTRDRFADHILLTRALFGRKDNKNSNLAYKMSISFHPDDNDKLSYEEVFKIAQEFAERFLRIMKCCSQSILILSISTFIS